MSNPTGSSLDRAFNCPASCALPHVAIDSADAARGTALHRFVERVAQIGIEDALAEVAPDYLYAAEAVELDKLVCLVPGWRQEVAYRYDLLTGAAEITGYGIGRKYGPKDPRYVYGTIDAAKPGSTVRDLKFEGCESHTPPLPGNRQLRFAALCEARVSGSISIAAGIDHIGPTGRVRPEDCELDSFALDEFEAELREVIIPRVREAEAVVAAGQTPDVRRGPWCRYCPAGASCPSVTALIRAVALEPAKTAEEIRAALTPATARAAYLRLQEVKEALAPVAQALHLYADEFPIDLGDGYVYGARETRREKVDGRKARDVLARTFSPEVALDACDFTTSKTAIGKAIGPVAKAAKAAGQKVTKKALVESALAEIAKAGGIAETVSRKVSRHRADGSDADEGDDD